MINSFMGGRFSICASIPVFSVPVFGALTTRCTRSTDDTEQRQQIISRSKRGSTISFCSNSPACILRACWGQIGDGGISGPQRVLAFGESGWDRFYTWGGRSPHSNLRYLGAAIGSFLDLRAAHCSIQCFRCVRPLCGHSGRCKTSCPAAVVRLPTLSVVTPNNSSQSALYRS
jgi:hypothetical protein